MSAKRIASRSFHLLLFVLASYYVVKQFLQFLENKDSSAMTLRKFNNLEKDKYPTFSLCLTVEEDPKQWRNLEIIKNFNGKLDITLFIAIIHFSFLIIQQRLTGKKDTLVPDVLHTSDSLSEANLLF